MDGPCLTNVWQPTKLNLQPTQAAYNVFNAHVLSTGKWPNVHMAFGSLQQRFQKILHIFGPPLPTEYVTVFSGRTDAQR